MPGNDIQTKPKLLPITLDVGPCRRESGNTEPLRGCSILFGKIGPCLINDILRQLRLCLCLETAPQVGAGFSLKVQRQAVEPLCAGARHAP